MNRDISFECPKCNKMIVARSYEIGDNVLCPHCSGEIIVPNIAPEETPPPDEARAKEKEERAKKCDECGNRLGFWTAFDYEGKKVCPACHKRLLDATSQDHPAENGQERFTALRTVAFFYTFTGYLLGIMSIIALVLAIVEKNLNLFLGSGFVGAWIIVSQFAMGAGIKLFIDVSDDIRAIRSSLEKASVENRDSHAIDTKGM